MTDTRRYRLQARHGNAEYDVLAGSDEPADTHDGFFLARDSDPHEISQKSGYRVWTRSLAGGARGTVLVILDVTSG